MNTETAVPVDAPKQGFMHEGKLIFFINKMGKDVSFDRWRAHLYYKPHLACLVLFPSLEAYNGFLAETEKLVYGSYSDFSVAFDLGIYYAQLPDDGTEQDAMMQSVIKPLIAQRCIPLV